MNIKAALHRVRSFRMSVDAARLVSGAILHKAAELATEVENVLTAFAETFPPPPEPEEPIRHATSPCPPFTEDPHVNGNASS